jgi:uncharacterized protein VirK/YbjX
LYLDVYFGANMFLIIESARYLSRADQPLGGKAVWKYLLRSALQFRGSQRWASFLLEDGEYRQMLRLQPRLLLKPHRPYLRKDATAAQRVHWLMDHYRWVRETWSSDFTLGLYQNRQRQLAELETEGGTRYQLTLRPTCKFDREGELLISLERDGLPLAVVSFAMVRRDTEWVANVGCLQGASPELGRDAVKAATTDLHGLRPKQAVLTALYTFARGYGVDRVLAVGNDDHVHMARRSSREKISADYDSFWREMGGEMAGDSFVLPRRLTRKSGDEIPSRKRAQYRRRQGLEDSMIAQIRAALPNCANVPVFQTRPVALNLGAVAETVSVESKQAVNYAPLRIAA